MSASERGQVWADAVASFRAEQDSLGEAQLQWLDDAARLADGLSSSSDELGQTLSRVRGLVARAEGLFTRDQLGSFFSRQGSLQTWLVEMGVVVAPYCNCTPIGGSCSGGGYPAGSTCQQNSCTTWSDGSYYVGLCGPGVE